MVLVSPLRQPEVGLELGLLIRCVDAVGDEELGSSRAFVLAQQKLPGLAALDTRAWASCDEALGGSWVLSA